MAGWVALEKMVMLVLLMLVGFAAAKAQWVDSAFSQKTSRLVANVFIVATILSSVVGVQPLLTGGEMAVVVAAVFVLFAIAGVLGWVCARLLPLSQGDRTAAWLSVFFMNNVFVGFPVVEALFGESAVFCASLTTLPFNLLLFSLGVSRLRAGQGQGRVTLREVFSPALVGPLAAMVIQGAVVTGQSTKICIWSGMTSKAFIIYPYASQISERIFFKVSSIPSHLNFGHHII